MQYQSSILRTEAAYYQLNMARVVNGLMQLDAGGSAKYTVTEADLANVTDWIKVNIVASPFADNYAPRLLVYVSAQLVEGKSFDYCLTPNVSTGNVYSVELQMEEGAYASFTFEVVALDAATLTLWELCPETSADVETIIDGVKQSLPHLLYDYNMTPLVVAQEPTTIGLITFQLKDNTDINGHFVVTCIASDQCTLFLRFYDTGTQELYSPMQYDLEIGLNTIGVPHSYLHRFAGLHSVYVVAQVTTGQLSIGTRNVLYTIDAGYLAERIADLGVNTRDITITHESEAREPSYVYAIGVDENTALVRRRKYSADASEAFEPVYAVDAAVDAAIEFAGLWSLNNSREDYQLVTEPEPWIFLVDSNGNLTTQNGIDESTRQTLDTNVSSVSACMGFNSELNPVQDQGLVCAYIKAGKVYYWSRYYHEAVTMWRGPIGVDIPGEPNYTALNVHVHRLNDYRIALAITTEVNNWWLITERTYVNQAFRPETFRVMLGITPTTVGMLPASSSASASDLAVLQGTTEMRDNTLRATFNMPIRLVDTWSTREFFSYSNDNFYITDVAVENETTLVVILNDTVNSSGTLTWMLNGMFQCYYAYGCWAPAPRLTIPFTLHADYAETFSISVAAASASVSMRGIETTDTAYTDAFNIGLSAASGSAIMRPIITTHYVAKPETFSVGVDSATASVTITQTGVSPI